MHIESHGEVNFRLCTVRGCENLETGFEAPVIKRSTFRDRQQLGPVEVAASQLQPLRV